jgi:hypothetical protein
MNDDTNLSELERRLSRSLHAVAPRPAPGLADRLLGQTAVMGQRRPWMGLRFAPALAAAVVVVVAIVAGLALGTLLPRNDRIGGPSATEAPSPSAATPSAQVSPSEAASSQPSPSAGALADGDRCESSSFGYSVSYPSDWWANDAVVPDAPELTPIPACVAFAEAPVELMPNSQLPPAVAISGGITEPPPDDATQPIEVLSSRQVEVAGRPAEVIETRWTEDVLFFRAGDRLYEYRIELPSGHTLLFNTHMNEIIDDEAYEAHKLVLDAMMETLELTGG